MDWMATWVEKGDAERVYTVTRRERGIKEEEFAG